MTFVLDGIDAGYGRVQVLYDVSVSVAPGEIVALLGPNGAGKSTLLRAATGMIRLSRGSVRLGDRDLTGASIEAIARAGVSHVPEGRRLFPGLTVRDNLRLGGWRSRNDDMAAVLALFPLLGERLGQVAGSLSGGEQQMCAIGRALMSRPEYLLVDELSLGLAPLLVDDIMSRLTAVAANGTGVLLVEQDAGHALEPRSDLLAGRGRAQLPRRILQRMHGARLGLRAGALGGLRHIGGDAQRNIAGAGMTRFLARLLVQLQPLSQLGHRGIGADENRVSHAADEREGVCARQRNSDRRVWLLIGLGH